MKKEVVVLSLGGSLIIPNNVDITFLRKFKKVILRNIKKYKFIVVCGGGSIARKYISALRGEGLNKKLLEKYLKKHSMVFCGALEYKSKQTSDSTSANLARIFKSVFINLTDVPGLYNKNPKEYKNAKFISGISWKNFHKMASKSKYTPGQHFVLDQTASEIIMKNKIKTYILGKNLKQLENVLKGKKFKGTLIKG